MLGIRQTRVSHRTCGLLATSCNSNNMPTNSRTAASRGGAGDKRYVHIVISGCNHKLWRWKHSTDLSLCTDEDPQENQAEPPCTCASSHHCRIFILMAVYQCVFDCRKDVVAAVGRRLFCLFRQSYPVLRWIGLDPPLHTC